MVWIKRNIKSAFYVRVTNIFCVNMQHILGTEQKA